jgi:hypothetical protein
LTLITLLISILALALAVLLYRKRPIILIYMLVTNITLRLTAEEEKTAPIILIDHSMSMKNHIPHILGTLAKLHQPHESFFFHESLLTKEKPDDLGTYTDITAALKEASKLQPAVMILMTDGNHNFGTSPLSIVAELDEPIYIYGFGEERPRDISIVDVIYPVYAYPNDTTEIDLVVETSGFPRGRGEATMQLVSGKTLATQSFPLSDVPARNQLKYVYVAKEPGTTSLKISLTPQSNEASYDNNQLTVSLNVVEDKINVLYYTDHLSFNTKFILRAITQDRNLNLSAISRSSVNQYQDIEQRSEVTTLPDISTFDVVILDNVSLGALPWANISDVAEQGKGIVLCGMLETINAQWREILPIDVLAATAKGVFRLEVSEPFSVLTNENHPPVKSIQRILGSKQDASIIARANNLPLVGYRVHGRGKIFQICATDLGTWHFLQHGLREHDFLHYFLGDVIRLLSPMGEHRRLVVDAPRREYAIGATIDFSLQSYDRNFRRAGGGDFFLVVDEQKIPFYEVGEGFYEARLVVKDTSTLHVSAQGQLGEEKLLSNEFDINVLARAVETEYRLNRVLLNKLAEATNGRFFSPKQTDSLVLPEVAKKQVSRVINLHSPIVYFVALFLLVADWILRRRRGIT